MGFFQSWKVRGTRPAWTYRVKGTIWRIIPTDFGKIVGEERDVASKQARFFCLGQRTGEVFWADLTLEEQWWIGIESVHRDLVLFHGFSTPELPEHKMITAVDLLTGKTLWSNRELAFVAATDDSVFAMSNATLGRTYCELDNRTGEKMRAVSSDDEEMRKAQRPPGFSADNEVMQPVPAVPGDYLAMMIDSHYDVDAIVGQVEAVEADDLVIFSYHEKTRQSTDQQLNLRNILKVVGKTREVDLFEEILNTHCSAPAPESFFVQCHMLYFVKERNELTALELQGFHAKQ